MTNLTNLFTDKIYSKLIDLTYKKSIIDSYNTAIKRDLYQDFYDDFKNLIVEIKKQKEYESYIDYIQKNNHLENEFKLYVENGGNFENKYEFLKENNLSTLKRFNLKSEPNYAKLKFIYNQKIPDDGITDNLNDDFLKVFVVTYGKISLYNLIELFIDIIIDLKEFDSIKYIEKLIFIDEVNPKSFFYKKNGFLVYHKALICYRYLDNTLDRNLILEKMYQCMDDNYDTNNNPIRHPDSTEEFSYYSYDGQDIGVVQKKDRVSKEFDLNKNIPKWTFSNIIQVENAYRLNLISKERYNKKIIYFSEKEIDSYSIISKFNFLKLSEDINFNPQSNPKEYFHKPNTNVFNELNEDQKSEYITAFSNDGDLHKITKYGRFRIERLVKAYLNNTNLKEKVIKELELIKQLTYFKEEIDIEIKNINIHYQLKGSKSLEKIEKAMEIISNSYHSKNQGICVRFNNKYYRFYYNFKYSDATILPTEIIDSILIGGNITEEEYHTWEYEYRNTDVSYKASSLNNSISRGEYTGLAANKKNDAPILISLLEKEYNDFIPFFKENLKTTQYSHFIDPLISRLMSAYIILDEYEKAISLADEFIEIKDTYTELYLTPEAENILMKREKCLLKMPYSYLPYEEANEFIKNLNLKSLEDWKLFKTSVNRPQNIPSNPDEIYKNNGWKGFTHWLGIKNKNQYVFLSYEEAREIVHLFKLTSEKEWKDFKSKGLKPDNIPALPERVYKDKGWKGFQDWLGYDANKLKYNFLPYEDARVFVHSLELESENQWREFKRIGIKPENIPSKPENVYKDKGWKGFKDWLGY
jgi:hypothetical protein